MADYNSTVEWRSTHQGCPCCSGTERVFLGHRGGRAHRAEKGLSTQIYRCRQCCAVYPDPALIPVGNPYEEFSADSYFERHQPEIKVQNGRDLARRASRLLGRKGRLLELGCGRGDLLVGAKLEGWEVFGVEMTPDFAAVGGVEIEIAKIEESTSLSRSYDVILLAAILEHVYDPIECLRRVRGALNPGGVVFIDVPNECALWTRVANLYFRLRGRDWAANLSPTFPPFHVVGFCPGSLKHALRRVGLVPVELATHRWKNLLPQRPGLGGRLESCVSETTLVAGAALGMGAGITCWARRRLTPELEITWP